MTKSDLLGIYRTSLNHIQLTYASLVLWSYPDTPDYFDVLYQELQDIPRPFPRISVLVRDEKAMRIACEELYESAHRAALVNLLPQTKLYCHETGQLAKLKAQPWFQFWRVLRNCVAHDMRFNFNASERALLPIAWSGVTITISMNNKLLTHGLLSREKIRELVESAQAFLEQDVG